MKSHKKISKAWCIVPIAAVTVFVLALTIKIFAPDILKIDRDKIGQDQDITVEDPTTPDPPIVDPNVSGEPDEPTPPEDPDIPEEPPIPEEPVTPEEPAAPGEAFADEWSLILINPTHSLPEDYEVELETVQNKYKMDYRAAEKAKEMIAAAEEDGITLLVCSAYRSHQRQTDNFNAKLNYYLDLGWEYEDAYSKTATIIAVPGTSEHETGLALDIVTPEYQVLDAGYADTDAAKWLLENAMDYGFILRFPKDKQDITKIIFEPWHYRYVGTEYSTQIMESGLCLEEWLGQVE